MAQQFKGLQSNYTQNRDLVSIGAYQQGADPALDRAIQKQPHIKNYIRQSLGEPVSFTAANQQLMQLLQDVPDKGRPLDPRNSP